MQSPYDALQPPSAHGALQRDRRTPPRPGCSRERIPEGGGATAAARASVSQKHFRWTICGPTSSYSSLVIHICWKVLRLARMEPPIQTEYFLSGGAMTFTLTPAGASAAQNTTDSDQHQCEQGYGGKAPYRSAPLPRGRRCRGTSWCRRT